MPAGEPVTERVVVARDVPAPAAKFAMPSLKMNAPESQAEAPAPLAASASSPLNAPQIARTAKVSLYVGNVDKAAAQLTRVAQRNGGDVFSSDVSNGDGSSSQPSASMKLRVPEERFNRTLSDVINTGTLRERSTSAEDLTSDLTDSQAKLRNLRRTEADIRAIMDRSGTVSQVMDAENQLSQVREQIETLESEIKEMRTRVAYATIDVDMEAEATTAPVTPTPASQLASAWRGAIAALAGFTVELLASALWLLVFLPYALVVAAVGWLIYLKLRPAFH